MISDPTLAMQDTARIINEAIQTGLIDVNGWWRIPCSGGKDSTTTAQAMLILIKDGVIPAPDGIVLLMADSLLEYREFGEQAVVRLEKMAEFGRGLGIKIVTNISRPLLHDTFFTRILGRGMVPPTENMRWCTDVLKIIPQRKYIQNREISETAVFLGVRWGESDRRDKMLSCSQGGECGLDTEYSKNMKVKKKRDLTITSIVNWRTCAIWDFLQFVAPSYGFDNESLINVYGPDGDNRFGCWTCPLIYDDKTGLYLSKNNPKLYELITFAGSHFRRGGSAWRAENRELFSETQIDNTLKPGRLSIRYCKNLFSRLTYLGYKHGTQYITPQEALMIRAYWQERRDLADYAVGQLTFPIEVDEPVVKKPLHVSQVDMPLAGVLDEAKLVNDNYHNLIQAAARKLSDMYSLRVWLYGGSGSTSCFWRTIDNNTEPELLAVYDFEDRKIDIRYV